jgi:hypothetical protein
MANHAHDLIKNTQTDPDFDISTIIAKLPSMFSAFKINNEYKYNASGIILICDKQHKDFYTYNSINSLMNCKTCKCGKRERSVLNVAEKMFKVVLVVPQPMIVISREYNIIIYIDPSMSKSTFDNGKIHLSPPYQRAHIQKNLHQLLVDNIEHLHPQLKLVIRAGIHRKVIKDQLPKTRDMVLLRDGPLAAQFDPDVLDGADAKLLCFENCYYH